MYTPQLLARKDDSPITNPDGNPQAQSGAILGGSSVLFAASTILVVLRFWSRIRRKSSRGHFGLWWDDWMAVAALMFLVPDFGFICSVFAPNAGRHIDSFTFEQRAFGTTVISVFALFFMYSMFCARCSALLFYHRVFVTGNKDWFRWLLVVLQGYNLCVMITFMSLLPFNCRMTDTPADRLRLSCHSPRETWIASASASFSADLLVALAPTHMISRLHLPTRWSKLVVAIPFACGIIVVGVSLGRLIVTIRKGYVLEHDITFSGMDVLWWPIAEMAAALMSICLPSIYGLIRTRLTDRRWSPHSTSAENGSSGGVVIEKSVAIGEESTRGSSHLSTISSRESNLMDAPAAPHPLSSRSLALSSDPESAPAPWAARQAPVAHGPVHELSCSGSGQSETNVTSNGRPPHRAKHNTTRNKVPRSIYFVAPRNDNTQGGQV